MAEDGPVSLVISRQGSHSLECPICLEQFRQPKSLPCRHTFCQECLSQYITMELSEKVGSTTFFSCPVCRRPTYPISQSDDIAVWAQQFPSDSLAVALLASQQHVEDSGYCSSCRIKGKKKIPAKFWCKTNKTYFCGPCKLNYHDYVHTECDVIKLAKRTFPTLENEAPPELCGAHENTMDYYCQNHQCLGCSECIKTEQRRCERVTTTTQQYVHKLKGTSQMHEVVSSLKESANAMGSMVADFKAQLEELVKDRDVALKSITDLRVRMDRCLDKLQHEIIHDLMIKVTHINQEIAESKEKCERLKSEIESTLESTGTVLQNENHMETVLLFQKGQAEISSFKHMMREMKKSFTSVTIKHEISSDCTTENNVFGTGKIVVHRTPRDFPVNMDIFAGFSKRCVKEVRKIKVKCPSDVVDCQSCGVVYLPNGRIVVSDYDNHKLKLFSEKGDYLDEVQVLYHPLDMCPVDKNSVAVLTTQPQFVCVVSVGSSKLTLCSRIKCPDKKCWGVTYAEGKFIVSCTKQIYSITKAGRTAQIQESNSTCPHLSYDSKNQDIVSSYASVRPGDIAVTRMTADKVTILLRVGIVKLAVGIDVDTEGNVYVCGGETNNVVQISRDGTKVRELLSSADGLDTPRAISFCGDKFVVTNQSKKDMNNIQLFRFDEM